MHSTRVNAWLDGKWVSLRHSFCRSGVEPRGCADANCIGIDDGLFRLQHDRVTDHPSSKQVAGRYASLFPEVYLKFHRRDDKRNELSGASRGVLLHLAQSGPLTIGECAKHLNRTQSVVSEIVEQLIRHGWLAKVRDATDRRRSVVWLTAQGRERLVADQEVLSRRALERATQRMTPEQRRMLLEGTEALLHSVKDVVSAGTPNQRKRTDE